MKRISDRMRGAAIIACLLFIISKLVFVKLFALFEPSVQDIHFEIIDRPAIFPTSLLFSLLMAAIPVLVACIWQIAPVISSGRKISVVVVITTCMAAGIFLRHYLVKNYFNGVVRPFLLEKNQLPMRYPIDPANFVYYMFAGCCAGCLISFLLFRQPAYGKQG
ncbi:MAG: hypothetical protein ABUT20_64010 [Bacteroidota bacterium]